jgi:anti-sigma28 factor (negative regulator of flagellin synthesis)
MNIINNNSISPQPQSTPSQGRVGGDSQHPNNQKTQQSDSVGYTPASDDKLRLAELRDAIAMGEYRVNFEEVAMNIVDSGDI